MKAAFLVPLASLLALTVPSDLAATPASHPAHSAYPTYLETPPGQKPRVVITTDPELDDSNSLVRYLLYSNDFRTEGLIYASSQYHWKGDGKGTTQDVPGREYNRNGVHLCPCTFYRWSPNERFVDDAVEAYAKDYPNLHVHSRDYPSPSYFKSKIRWGNVDFDGEMSKDTDGSNLIKSLLLDSLESPIYLHAWGGESTIARALKSIEEHYKDTPQWPAIRAKVIRKAVIHASGDQDDTYAKYIQPAWPEIRYRFQKGGIPLGYGAQNMVSLADARYFTPEWMRENVLSKGALGAHERVWGDGKQMVKGDRFDYFGLNESADELRKEGYIVWMPPQTKSSFLGEGDTGTFLNLIDNGLRGYRGDSFGGWGGALERDPQGAERRMRAMFAAIMAHPDQAPPRAPTQPFIAAAQRDFAARLIWATTQSYRAANHNPQVTLVAGRWLAAHPGQTITLQVRTSDPDKNKVNVRWWDWRDAGTYGGTVQLARTEGLRTSFRVPDDAKPGDTIQIVAEGTDDGTPALTHYDKAVVTVR